MSNKETNSPTIVDLLKLYSSSQKPNETLEAFLLRLSRIAADLNLGKLADCMIATQFAIGIRNKKISHSLMNIEISSAEQALARALRQQKKLKRKKTKVEFHVTL